MSLNRVEVLLITYNHENYLLAALRSIENQLIDLEVVVKVFDDNSTDNSLALIKEFSSSSPLKIEIHESNHKFGIIKNYERAFANINSDWVAILEGDDFWFSNNHLQNNIENLQRFPFANLSFSTILIQEEDSQLINVKTYPKKTILNPNDLACENFIGNFSCCVYRGDRLKGITEHFVTIGGYDWLANLLIGSDSYYVRSWDSYSVYRIHQSGQWSSLSQRDKTREVIQAIDKYQPLLGDQFSLGFQEHKKRLIDSLIILEYSKNSFLFWTWKVTTAFLPAKIVSSLRSQIRKLISKNRIGPIK
jgi:glycosyltransferase involved in cell wall biosynthesis